MLKRIKAAFNKIKSALKNRKNNKVTIVKKKKSHPLLDRLSGIWLAADGIGTMCLIVGALYIGFTTGVWALGAFIIAFEVIGMLNSFYCAHRIAT